MNRPEIAKEFKAFTNLSVHSLYRFEFFGRFMERVGTLNLGFTLLACYRFGAFDAGAALIYLSANFRNVGQFGPSVWPPLC